MFVMVRCTCQAHFSLAALLFTLSIAAPRSLFQTGSLPGAGVYPQCEEPGENAQFNAGQACVGCVQVGQDCPPQCCAQDLVDGQVLLCVVGACCNRVVLTNDGGVVYGMEALSASARGDQGICGGVGPVPNLKEDAQAGCGQCAAGFSNKDDSGTIVDCRGVGYHMPAYTEPGRALPSACADGSGKSGGFVEIGGGSIGTNAPSSGNVTGESGSGIIIEAPDESVSAQGEDGSDEQKTSAPSTSASLSADQSSDREVSTDEPACFPGDGVVQYADGTTRSMKDVAVGDIVRVGPSSFSPVFMFTHRLPDGNRWFLRISTSTGEVIELTSGHYLYINGALDAAKHAKVGDLLLRANGEVTEIQAIASTRRPGLYNPQTISGDIVVGNLLVSTYTMAVPAPLAHALLSPLRVLAQAGFYFHAFERDAPKCLLALASLYVQ